MRIKWTHWMPVLLIGILMAALTDPVRAVDTYTVSTDASVIRRVDDTHYIIPICITQNQGIMGFRIVLQSDEACGGITGISKGTVTQKGSLNTDLNTLSGKSVVNVLWTATEECKKDGSLFYVTFELKDKDVKKIELSVAYEQQDTFNEKYEDVTLACRNVVYALPEERSVQDQETTSDLTALLADKEEQQLYDEASKAVADADTPVTEEMIKYAVIHALNAHDYASLEYVPEQGADDFWSDVRDYLKEDCGITESELKKLDVQEIAEQTVISEDDFVKYSPDEAAPKRADLRRAPENRVLYAGIAAGVLLLLLVAGIWVVRRFGHGSKN